MNKEKKTYNIDLMTDAGKKTKLAGKEYEILPVKIEDMKYIIGENEEERFIIPDKKEIENGNISWSVFGINVMGERKDIFMKMLNKYVFYKEHPMTEDMVNEHNWSFKEIGTFLYFWIQDVSE